MLSVHGRKPAAVFVEPIARVLNRTGISPNAVTIVGALASVLVAVVLIPADHLVAAALVSAFFCAFDMVDGTMARLRGGGTAVGATLDASCDRITDGALFAAVTWWLIYTYDAPRTLVVAAFITLVASQVISYVKARAEASGLQVIGGLIERPERLIIVLTGIGLQGLGVPLAVDVAIYALAVGSVATVFQRFYLAVRSQEM